MGQGKTEEELEGEVIVGPSEKAVGSQVIPLSFSLELNYLSNHAVSLLYGFPLFFKNWSYQIKTSAYQIIQPDPLCAFGIVSLADESSKSEETKATTQEEYEVDWAHSWIKARGCQLWQKRRCRGYWIRYFSAWYCLDFLTALFIVLWLSLAFVTGLFSFPGAAFTAVSQFVERGGTVVGGRGITESRTGCGRNGGRGFIQASEGCSVTFLHVLCPTPT